MSAERMPQTDEGRADGSWLAAPLEALTRLVLRAPRLVLALAGALAVAAVLLSVRDLGFRTSRLDLLNPKSDFNQLWLEYLDEFGEGDDAVIVVRGTDREAVAEAIDSMAEALTEDERSFEQVLSRVELDVINSKGLYYLTLEELNGLEDSLDEIQPLLNGDWSQIRVDHQLRSAATAASDPTTGLQQRMAAAHLDRLSTTFASTLSDELDNYVSPWLIADSLSAREGEAIDKLAANGGRMTTGEGRMGFILLRLTQDSEQKIDSTSRSIARLRDLIAHTQEGQPDVTIGLTGLPIMEHDEMQASQSDMVRASVISLIGVACLFIAGLGGVRHPLLTVCTLLLAIAWSFGYITFAVGHLNILSVAFGVILIGLGIDFGIHYVARYLQLREESQTAAQAIIATSSSVGPGVFVGAVTTALAFFAAYFTQFTGVAELGVIAGGGILLCLLATIVVLPTLL